MSSPSVLPMKVALIDKTGNVPFEELSIVADAINTQVTRDLSQFWAVSASVIALPNAPSVPTGVWPVFILDTLPAGEGGVHLTKHRQPYAKVEFSENGAWTLAASHEVLEMLVDPSGNRLQASVATDLVGGKQQDVPGQFEYLVELCDPCEAPEHAYVIGGVVVSDFITPHFYDRLKVAGTRYSFTGALTAPRLVLPGGYLTWVNPQTQSFQQLNWARSPDPEILGMEGLAEKGGSLRQLVDAHTRTVVELSRTPEDHPVMKAARERRQALNLAAAKRSELYRL